MKLTSLAASLCGLITIISASGQTSLWTAGDGDWTLDANWDTPTNPNGAGQSAVIDTTGTDVTVSLDATRTITDLTIAIGDQLTLLNSFDLNVLGTIQNDGFIFLDASTLLTDLIIPTAAPGVSLNGSGTVRLGDTNARITGSGLLTNTGGHTITGVGQIGTNTLGINNLGLIQANGGTLNFDPSSVQGATNSGTLQAANGGTLILTGSGGGKFTNTSGTIEALAGSEVRLTTNATITGGTLTGSGEIRAATNQTASLTDLTNASTFISENNTDLNISGTIENTGSIEMRATNLNTDLEVQASGATLTGGGDVILSGALAGINGAAGARLTNVDNTISGQGALGENTIAITNQSTITANVAGETLTLDPRTTPTDGGLSFDNQGTLRAENGATLQLTGSGGGEFTNTSGTIEALASSEVRLTTNAAITGGTLTGLGEFRATANQTVSLNDLTNAGTFISENNTDLNISGTIENTGTIEMRATTLNTDLEVQSGGATLTGGGEVILSGALAGINGATGARLTNVDNTISGQGALGENTIAITNQSTITANVAGETLTLDPRTTPTDSGLSFDNQGTLRAENGATLQLTGSGGGEFTNTSGTIEALAGSEVRLTTNAAITGGTLTGPGEFRATANQTVSLNDLTNAGTFISENNTDLNISGTIENTGTIEMRATTLNTDLEVQSGGATLTGGGEVILSGALAGINGATGARLTNVDNTISGQGAIGENTIAITNSESGIIEANVSGGTLTINPAASPTDMGASFQNDGILRASNNATLRLSGSSRGDFTNGSTGIIEALDDSAVTTVINGTFTNNIAGILTEGTYRAISTGNGADVTLNGPAITEIATNTTVEVSGVNSNITFGGTAIEDTLTSNAGTLRIGTGRTFTNTAALGNSGTLDLQGGTFAAPALTNSGATTGFGTVDVRPTNSGSVTATGGTLTFAAGFAGNGTATVDAGATLDISGGTSGSATSTLAQNGTLALGTNDITASSDYTNANFGSGNTFDPRANVTGTGHILATGDTDQSISTNVIDFGNVHVGDTATQNYHLSNSGTSGSALRGALQTTINGGNITDSRLSGTGVTAANYGPLASGENTGDLAVTYTATNAGALTGQQVNVINNFDNVSSDTVQITGAAYRLASAEITPKTVDFGIVHVGDIVSPQAITVGNSATADSFSESLDATISGTGSSGSIDSLAPGGINSTALTISLDTASAGIFTSTSIVSLTSDGTGSSDLGQTALGTQDIAVSAQVNNFAVASLAQESGSASLTIDAPFEFTLDFGTVVEGNIANTAILSLTNDVTGPADTLSSAFDISGATDFMLNGFDDFSGLAAGFKITSLVLSLDTNTTGAFTGIFEIDPSSQNTSGFNGTLDTITVNLIGNVIAVPEPRTAFLLGLTGLASLLRRRRSQY